MNLPQRRLLHVWPLVCRSCDQRGKSAWVVLPALLLGSVLASGVMVTLQFVSAGPVDDDETVGAFCLHVPLRGCPGVFEEWFGNRFSHHVF